MRKRPTPQEPRVLGQGFVEEILGRPVSSEDLRAWRYRLAPFESNLLMADLKAQRLKAGDGTSLPLKVLSLGASTLSLEQLHEQMGDDLFFWPPFWHRLLRLTRLARHPHYMSGPRRYRKTLEDMSPPLDEAFIDSLVKTNTAESVRERSDRARQGVGSFFGSLISRGSVRKRKSEFLLYLREDYLKVPVGKRSAWLAQKAEETGYPPRTLERYVRPSLPKKKKTSAP